MEIAQSKQANMKTSVFTCSQCGGTGKLIVKQSTQRELEVYGHQELVDYYVDCPSCNGGFRRIVEEKRIVSNVPALYYDKHLSDFRWDCYNANMSEAQKLICDFIEGYREYQKESFGLYIHSNMRGTGKTMLASCICRELMDKYAITTKFVQVTQLIEIAKNHPEWIDLFCVCELLVLDDIGANNTEWINDILLKILDARYQNKLSVIATSNLNIAGLSNFLDDRIVDRLYSMTMTVELPDCGMRQQDADKRKKELLRKRGLIK